MNITIIAFNQTLAYRLDKLSQYFALKGRKEEAIKVIQNQANAKNIIKSYSTASLLLLQSPTGPKEHAYVYLDSAITEFKRLKGSIFNFNNPRVALVLTPAMIGGKDMEALSLRFIREVELNQQSGVVQHFVMGTALRGDYYKAYSSIPELTLVERIHYYDIILTVDGKKRATDPEWEKYFNNYNDVWTYQLVGYDYEFF